MLLAMELPSWLEFLGLGWFIWHALAVAGVYYLGVLAGRRYERQQAGRQASKPATDSEQ
jgi:hypothetical protein